jgi:hypothetical protein
MTIKDIIKQTEGRHLEFIPGAVWFCALQANAVARLRSITPVQAERSPGYSVCFSAPTPKRVELLRSSIAQQDLQQKQQDLQQELHNPTMYTEALRKVTETALSKKQRNGER